MQSHPRRFWKKPSTERCQALKLESEPEEAAGCWMLLAHHLLQELSSGETAQCRSLAREHGDQKKKPSSSRDPYRHLLTKLKNSKQVGKGEIVLEHLHYCRVGHGGVNLDMRVSVFQTRTIYLFTNFLNKSEFPRRQKLLIIITCMPRI